MIDVCWGCGEFTPEKRVDAAGAADRATATCPACGHEHPFPYRPLLLVCGPSGGGKTSVLRALLDHEVAGRVLPLEADVLWAEGTDPRAFADRWLRVCRDAGRAGRPVVLFGAGLTPENVEPSPYRRYFEGVHHLALVAGEDALRERLADRPAWRGTDEAFADDQVAFDRHLRAAGEGDEGKDGLTVVDTAGRGVGATVERVAAWVRERT